MEHVFLYAILSASALLALGLWLRATVRPLQVLYIPAAVIAGLIGFALVQLLQWGLPNTVATIKPITSELGTWPGMLIAVVFAGLLLERSSGKGLGQALSRGVRSGILAWIIILGQIAIGLGVYLVLVRPSQPGVHPSFGQLLEVSWAGGHGTSGAMGTVYSGLGFVEGRDLAFFLATVGLIYGVVSGLVFVNLAVRRGWTHGGRSGIPIVTGLEPRHDPAPAAYAKTRGEVLEPLVLQIIILAAAFGVGRGLQQLFLFGASKVLPPDDLAVRDQAIDSVNQLPLFLFTLLGGLIVRELMRVLRISDLIDSSSIQRLLGVAMEFLIVAAITTMRVEALQTFFVPVVALLVLAAIWSTLCLLVFARQILPKRYWFELGLLNYGFSTANTPQGMMLLRIVDPDLRSGAAEDYAVAAPLSAPFLGGGIITFTLPLLLGAGYVTMTMASCLALIALLYIAGLLIARKSNGSCMNDNGA